MTPIKMTTFSLALTLALAACSSASAPGGPPEEDPPNESPAPEVTADFAIALSTDKLPVLQGSTASVEVTLTRKNGFTGAVRVSTEGLPIGATIAPITFEGATTKATLTVTAEAAAPHSLPTNVTVTGASEEGEVEEALTVTVYGPPGSLDTSFAGGKVVMPIGDSDDYAYALAVQPDGKILIAGRVSENLGDFAVVRLERDGTPDATFGEGGKVTTPIGLDTETAYAIAVQPDGKIVLAGNSKTASDGLDFALVRYLPDGKLDPDFGAQGKVTTAFTNDSDTAYAILIEPDGKIVVGGEANRGTATTGFDFALARYLPNGQLDPSFGEGGRVTTPIRSSNGGDTIYSLAVQDIGGERCIVAAGGSGDFSLARYRANGALDDRFGTQGKITGVFGVPIGEARAVKIFGGKIIVAGQADNDFAVARFTDQGQPDVDFGQAGRVKTPINAENDDSAQGLDVEADGKIVVGGWVNEGSSTSKNFALVRYDTKGALDPTFGGTGIVVTEVAAKPKTDLANAMLLQSDERVPTTRVLLAGYASDSNYDFAVARYWR